jgi:dihydroorotate dehydrogenase electron transfer subunit
MMKRTTATIIENAKMAPGIYCLTLAGAREAGSVLAADGGAAGIGAAAADDGVAAIAAAAAPGQFVNIYLNNDALLLPRPLGISDVESVDGGGSRLVFVYAVVGAGTVELASYAPGTELSLLGPQGNGYDLERTGRRVLLIGGGLGVPPLLFAARRLREGAAPGKGMAAGGAQEALCGGKVTEPDSAPKITALLGYRNAPYYSEEMGRYCDEVFAASEFRKDGGTGEENGREELNGGAEEMRGGADSDGEAEPEDRAHETCRGGAPPARGTVMDLIARLEADGGLDLADASVLACGPLPMLRAVSEWAAARGVPAQVSLEERMGCGYGACVGCTIAVNTGDAHSGLHNVASAAACGVTRRKVCKDGPVFPSDVIVW